MNIIYNNDMYKKILETEEMLSVYLLLLIYNEN